MNIFSLNILQRTFLFLFMAAALLLVGCEGAAGPQGPQGQQGPVGPVGPAGEDGSVMYAGPDAPTSDIGQEGDYYLNTSTGEYYGPKDSNGWGNPIIVLMGEDGEDGSQIYSGNGAPDASLGDEGDYYLDKSSYDLYGPKTASGWGSPVNIKGADGNANVTRYIANGHDFSATYSNIITIGSVSKNEMLESSWLFYLVDQSSSGNTDEIFYPIPGPASINFTEVIYNVRYFYRDASSHVEFQISAVGDYNTYGKAFERIEIVQIEESSRVDLRKVNSGESFIPDDLDTSNYQEVANYYGFYK